MCCSQALAPFSKEARETPRKRGCDFGSGNRAIMAGLQNKRLSFPKIRALPARREASLDVSNFAWSQFKTKAVLEPTKFPVEFRKGKTK